MAARGVDLGALVQDLRRQVSVLEDDLRARSEEVDQFAAARASTSGWCRAMDRRV